VDFARPDAEGQAFQYFFISVHYGRVQVSYLKHRALF